MKSLPEAILVIALTVIIAIMALFAYDLFAKKGTRISFNRVETKPFVPPVAENKQEEFVVYSGPELWLKQVKIKFEPAPVDFEALIKEKKALLAKKPDDIEAMYALGVLNFMLEQQALANRYYKDVLNKDPENKSAKLAQAYLFYYAGEKPKAKDLMSKYVSENPSDVDYLLSSGVMYQMMGEKNTARDFFSKTLQKEPTNKFAKNALISLSK